METAQAERLLEQNSYRVKKFIGEGACSKVFKCKNPDGETVAVKVICSDEPGAVEREINSAHDIEKAKPLDLSKYPMFKFSEATKNRSQWYNKNLSVPKVKEVTDENGLKKFIIEEPLADADIFDSVLNVERLPGKKVDYKKLQKIAKSVLRALYVLHARGFAHYDIKPENILQCKTEAGLTKYKLGDFGLSGSTRAPKNGDPEYRCKGTPAYAAPELLESSTLEHLLKGTGGEVKKVDIYSLGATLFRLFLSQKGSFTNDGDFERAIINLQNGSIFKSEDTNNVIKRNFLDFIRICVAKDPARRPTAAKALQHPFIALTIDKQALFEKPPQFKKIKRSNSI